MLVMKWMSKDVVTVEANQAAVEAQILLKENNIERLPVMEKGNLVGVVTKRDFMRMPFPSETLKVKHVMTRDPITVPWNYTVGEAAEILLRNHVSGLPVVDPHGKVVGIITKGDLFSVLVPLTGVGRKGIQLALLVDDRPGAIKEITDIIRSYGGRMMSALTSYDEAPKGYLRLYLRMHGINRKKFKKMKDKIREKASFLYLVDHREGKRELYQTE